MRPFCLLTMRIYFRSPSSRRNEPFSLTSPTRFRTILTPASIPRQDSGEKLLVHVHQFDKEGFFARVLEPSAMRELLLETRTLAPNLTPESDTPECRSCHNPEEIENPGFTKNRRMIAGHVISGVYLNLKFAHIAHFRSKEQFDLNCTTSPLRSFRRAPVLRILTLPKMLACVECHDVSKDLPEEFRMSNCVTCHTLNFA